MPPTPRYFFSSCILHTAVNTGELLFLPGRRHPIRGLFCRQPAEGTGPDIAVVAPQQQSAKHEDGDDNDAGDDAGQGEKINEGCGGSGDGRQGFCPVCTGPPIIIPGPTSQGIAGEGKEPLFRYMGEHTSRDPYRCCRVYFEICVG